MLPMVLMGFGCFVVITMVCLGVLGFVVLKNVQGTPAPADDTSAKGLSKETPQKQPDKTGSPATPNNPVTTTPAVPPVIKDGNYMLQFVEGGGTCLTSVTALEINTLKLDAIKVSTCDAKDNGHQWEITIQPTFDEVKSSITPSSVASVNTDSIFLKSLSSTLCLFNNAEHKDFLGQNDCSKQASEKHWYIDYVQKENHVMLRNNHSKKCLTSVPGSDKWATTGECNVNDTKTHLVLKRI